MEAAHPLSAASLIGSDIVDVELRLVELAGGGRWRDVNLEVSSFCECFDLLAAVAAEVSGRRDEIAEGLAEACRVEAGENGVERRAAAIACDDDGDLLCKDVLLIRFAAALARWPRQASLPSLQ